MTAQRKALETLLKTATYTRWASSHPVDARKVVMEWAGERHPTAGDPFAASIITLIRANPAPVVTPPPPGGDPFKFWRSRGFFQSWGLNPGSNWGDNPSAMTVFAASKGADWVAVQDTPANRAKSNAIRVALHAAGLKLAVWKWSSTTIASREAIDYWIPDAWIENVEHYDWDSSLPAYLRQRYPLLPMAVISNFSGTGATPAGTYDPTASAKWIDTGFAYIPECYMVNEHGAQPTLSPQNQEWTAVQQLKWPRERVFPCFGLYRTTPEYFDLWRSIWPLRKPNLDFYKSEVAQYPYHSFYLLENLA